MSGWWHRTTFPTTSCPRSIGAPPSSPTRASSRASGCLPSRRWRLGLPWSRRPIRPSTKPPATRRFASTRRARSRSQQGSSELCGSASASLANGLEHAKRFTWRACGEAHLRGSVEPHLRHFRRMIRVGLDTSPLALSKAGTARYLTKLLDGLEQEPAIELARLSWDADGRAAKVARDTFWYPTRLPRAARQDGRRRPPLSDDARAAPLERPTRRDDPRRRRPSSSRGVQRLDPTLQRPDAAPRRAGRRARSSSAPRSRATRSSSCSTCRRRRCG